MSARMHHEEGTLSVSTLARTIKHDLNLYPLTSRQRFFNRRVICSNILEMMVTVLVGRLIAKGDGRDDGHDGDGSCCHRDGEGDDDG